MAYLLVAAILFGFVHPGAKLILDRNIDLLSFCVLIVLIRVIPQAVIAIVKKNLRLSSSRILLLMLAVGLAGAFLQIFEFLGLTEGLSVPIVTLLVYTHPLWSLVLSRVISKAPITPLAVSKIGLGLMGLVLILWSQIQINNDFHIGPYLAPLFAGFCLAMWITLSHKIQNENVSFLTLSFYYDLICLFILIGIWVAKFRLNPPLGEVTDWLMSSHNLLWITAYSIFAGLVPNFLFYVGNKKVSPVACSLILLLEPVVSVTIAYILWRENLPPNFFVGAILILAANAPIDTFLKSKLKS